jgi:hypothetical protein
MKNYKAGEYTIQEHVKQCWYLMDLPPRNYLKKRLKNLQEQENAK